MYNMHLNLFVIDAIWFFIYFLNVSFKLRGNINRLYTILFTGNIKKPYMYMYAMFVYHLLVTRFSLLFLSFLFLRPVVIVREFDLQLPM